MEKKFLLLSLILFAFALFSFWLFSQKRNQTSSCLIFEEKFCKLGKEVYLKGEFAGIGFLLPKGAKVFAPFRAALSLTPVFNLPVKEGYKQYPAVSLTYLDGSKKSLGIAFKKMDILIDKEREVEKGEALGLASEEKIEALGDYNLFLSFADYHGKGIRYSAKNFWQFFLQK